MVEKEAETERKKAIIEAEKEAQVAKINFEKQIMEKESVQKMAAIDDEIHLAKERSRTDAEFYRVERQAEANRLLLTREFLELRRIESVASNQKVYFGPDIPNTFFNTEAGSEGGTKMGGGGVLEGAASAVVVEGAAKATKS